MLVSALTGYDAKRIVGIIAGSARRTQLACDLIADPRCAAGYERDLRARVLADEPQLRMWGDPHRGSLQAERGFGEEQLIRESKLLVAGFCMHDSCSPCPSADHLGTATASTRYCRALDCLRGTWR